MLKIRLQRVGRRNDASFRVIVVDARRAAKKGGAVEILGMYDPKRDVRSVRADRVRYWLSVGAQPSDTVHNILVTEGVLTGEKRNVLPRKSAPAHDTTGQQENTDESADTSTAGDGAAPVEEEKSEEVAA